MLQVGRSCIKGGPADRGAEPRRRPVSTRVLAHRGDARRAPENTLAAFAAALEAGADGVELDVRATRDGAVVVHHDRVLPDGRAIAELRAAELGDLVATLDDALACCAGAFVNVEVKNERDAPGYDASGTLAAQVARLVAARCEPGGAVISSFDLATLDAVREAQPEVATGLLVPLEADTTRAIARCEAHGFAAVHPFVLRVGADEVELAHRGGLEVAVWTVNARADLAVMLSLGVDSIITDDVALALEVREQHGPGLAEAAPPPLE